MHFPLSVALARLVEEDNIPTIARHHDFWWERERFRNSTMFSFFQKWFPPQLKSISHCVLNSLSQKELQKRTGIKAEVISDTFNFNQKKNEPDRFSCNWRSDFRIKPDDIVFLQPTRIVPRKRIEIAIKLVKKLADPRIILVVAGHSGDEGGEYEKKIRRLSQEENIRCRFISRFVNSRRRQLERRIYTLWDCFVNSDFVTYPTEREGFGNQLIESVYFKKPLILTPYPVYRSDIKPLNFNMLEITPDLKQKDVNKVRSMLDNKEKIRIITNKNFSSNRSYRS